MALRLTKCSYRLVVRIAALVIGVVGLGIAAYAFWLQRRDAPKMKPAPTLGEVARMTLGARRVANVSLVAVAVQTLALVLAFIA